jgi:calcium binding protein 39
MFARAKRKGLPKRLRSALGEFQHDSSARKGANVLSIVSSLNEIFNDEQFKAQDLPRSINCKLYRDTTVSLILQMLPFFDQQTLNSISTLLQSTIREFPAASLPQYLMGNRELLQQMLAYFTQGEAVATVCHILFRACLKIREFTAFVYELGVVGSFIQHLGGSDFDRLATAFGTYDMLLVTHPDISAEFLNSRWEIFQIQFKQLLSSPNYLVQLNFLPILLKFMTSVECRFLFLRYIDDIENLQLIMALLKSSSRRVQNHAYSIFKLFVQNPRRADPITSALRKNRVKLCKFLTDFQLDGADPELEDERRKVISIIDGLK